MSRTQIIEGAKQNLSSDSFERGFHHGNGVPLNLLKEEKKAVNGRVANLIELTGDKAEAERIAALSFGRGFLAGDKRYEERS